MFRPLSKPGYTMRVGLPCEDLGWGLPNAQTVGWFAKVAVIERASGEVPSPPPWLGVPPDLAVYRERGHRRLDARTYEAQCLVCIWGCRMPVEMIVDQWNPSQKRLPLRDLLLRPQVLSLYRPAQSGRFPAVAGCVGRRKTGWTNKPRPTVVKTNEPTLRCRGPRHSHGCDRAHERTTGRQASS